METYGFGGRLTEGFPSQVIIDPTEVCNLACTHCPHPTFKKSSAYGGHSLPIELNRKAIDEIASDGRGACTHVRYASDGEPLIHPRLLDMVADAVARSATFVSLTTNGTLLNEHRAARLLDTGVGLVDISLDAFTDETYARIRVKGDLSVTRPNVGRLIQLRDQGGYRTRIVVSFIEQPGNRLERADFDRYWRAVGADDVIIRPLHSAAGAIVPVADLMRQAPAQPRRRPCVYPWERIVLTPVGSLGFCPADWTRSSQFADFRETTIRETWMGAQYAALRAAHLSNDYTDHGFCGQCPDWQATVWPGQGRGYGQMIQELRETA
ncbi:MAG: radical SAM/SPASM domain-containing protein [Vicinamibacterales bacterium]